MNDQFNPDSPDKPDDPAASPVDPIGETTEQPTADTEVQSTDDGQRPYKRLLRSRSDRMLGGLAAGIANYFKIDPTIIRIAFGLSVFFGGFGIVAYLAGLIFIPSDGAEDDPRAPIQRAGVAGVIAAVLIGIAVLVGLGTLFAGAALLTGIGKGWIVALSLVGLGLALLITGFRSRARWLIAPAAALALGGGVIAATELDIEGGIGERNHTPTTIGAIPTNGYKLGIGELTVDLRELPWKQGTKVDLKTDLGIGETLVVVPDGVCVVGRAHAGAGDLYVAGNRTEGVGIDAYGFEGSASGGPTLEINSDVNLGEITIVNSETADLDGRRGSLRPSNTDDVRLDNSEACLA